ncbi:Mitochondrial ribonuclease P protein 1 [Araneus ventricosus]|uniref:RNA (guanine-9-)-methyltransferase domain-containing protein 1 n=1 Tax=Araneus ventricosus TaxID=182803 RepID=A0A4Y2T6J4_ARAVE|nr:Mitochondrial ribonuclease P protein 1 [Araneus ventricosus]
MNNFCRKFFFLKLFRNNGEIFCRQFSNSHISLKSKSSFNIIHHLRCKEVRFLHTGVGLRTANTGQELLESKEENSDSQQNDELDFKVAKYADLATDLEIKKKILMILMEHEVSKLEGRKVPSKISIEEMRELLSTYSYSSRVKYMRFLAEKELKRIAERRRKETRVIEREKWLIEKENLKPVEHIQYGIGHNTMILRVRRSSIFRYAYQRLANSVLYGQKFVVDMDFDCFMRKQDCNNCGEQLLELYSANRKNAYPFDLTFCNADLNSPTMSAFRKYMPNLYAPDNFITVTDLSYLDIYPKEKLVYITPYAKEPLKVYDHNAIYIIGGLVDKCIREPVVLAKAKREQIRAVHLPYDEYLMWGRGNKSLPLNHLLDILLEMKNTNDWKKAFKYVPQRKLVRSLDLYAEYS